MPGDTDRPRTSRREGFITGVVQLAALCFARVQGGPMSSSTTVTGGRPLPDVAIPATHAALRERLRRQHGTEFVKRICDLVSATAGLTLFLPLLPFLAIMVKLESPGPLLFRQARVGRDGRIFTCYKIRSMVADAEHIKDRYAHLNEADGAAFKIRQDPRITRVGSFVRRSSLDEFPQLLNVLRGEMSIVGPRPQIPSEVAQYTSEHKVRLLVKPGITCLWQVSGRNDVDFEEWMRLDREYVERRSLRLDFWILLRTLPAVIGRRGAY